MRLSRAGASPSKAFALLGSCLESAGGCTAPVLAAPALEFVGPGVQSDGRAYSQGPSPDLPPSSPSLSPAPLLMFSSPLLPPSPSSPLFTSLTLPSFARSCTVTKLRDGGVPETGPHVRTVDSGAMRLWGQKCPQGGCLAPGRAHWPVASR